MLARAEMDFPVGHREPRAEIERKPLAESYGIMHIQNEATRILLSRYSPSGVLVGATPSSDAMLPSPSR